MELQFVHGTVFFGCVLDVFFLHDNRFQPHHEWCIRCFYAADCRISKKNMYRLRVMHGKTKYYFVKFEIHLYSQLRWETFTHGNKIKTCQKEQTHTQTKSKISIWLAIKVCVTQNQFSFGKKIHLFSNLFGQIPLQKEQQQMEFDLFVRFCFVICSHFADLLDRANVSKWWINHMLYYLKSGFLSSGLME